MDLDKAIKVLQEQNDKNLEKFKQDFINSHGGSGSWLEKYMGHELPEDISPKELQDIYAFNTYRNLVIEYCGFTMVTKKVVNALVSEMERLTGKPHQLIRTMEIGCGLGVLSKGLSDAGVSVISVDNYARVNNGTFKMENLWLHNILNMDQLQAVDVYGKDVDFIIACWPEMTCNIDRIPQLMHSVNPNCRLIYCGEEYGGCTANDEFFDNVVEVDALVGVNHVYRRWMGIYDYWTLYDFRRKRDNHENKKR